MQAVKNAATGEKEGLDEDSLGMRWMEKANQLSRDATEGLDGVSGLFFGGVGSAAGAVQQQTATEPARTRSPGRVNVSQEDFAQAYRKRISENTEREIPAQYESFQEFASNQDAAEPAEGILTRGEIKERLAGLHDEKEIDQLVDGLLDEYEARMVKDRENTAQTAQGAETPLATEPLQVDQHTSDLRRML